MPPCGLDVSVSPIETVASGVAMRASCLLSMFPGSQEAFRASWARKKFGNYFERRIQSATLERKKWASGTFITLPRICHMMGGGLLGWISVRRGSNRADASFPHRPCVQTMEIMGATIDCPFAGGRDRCEMRSVVL